MSRSTSNGGAPDGGGGAEDLTAADVFQQLSESEDVGVDDDAVYDELAGESPDEIIASADEEPEAEIERLDDLLTDEDALDDLLLSGRTEEDGFLWIDTGAGSASHDEEEQAEEIDEEWTSAFEEGAGEETVSHEFGLENAYSFADASADSSTAESTADAANSDDATDEAAVDVPRDDDGVPILTLDVPRDDDEDDSGGGLLGRIKDFLSGLF